MASPLQPAMLLGSPSFPNAIAWSEENLIAVASGHIITILRPESPHGPHGVITVSTSEPLPIGVVERKDLLSGCLLPICLARDDKPVVRSLSWSPLGMAANAGCLMAVCTTEGNVKVYRPPFCDFCAEWVEVLDLTERLFEYLRGTGFGDLSIVAKQKLAGDMPDTVSRKGRKKRKVDYVSMDSGNQLLLPTISKDGNSCSSPCNDMEGRRSNAVSEILGSDLQITASDQMESMSESDGKSLKKTSENHMLPLITADQYASRSAMLSALVVSWSPLLHETSEFHPVPNTNASVSLLAVGEKSGKISFWRFHTPDCYTIQDSNIRTAVKLVGFLQAHDSWVTSISWVLFPSDFSNPQILLVTGSSDGRLGSVKVWLGDNDKLLKSSEANQSLFSLLKEVITVNVVPVSVLSATMPIQSSEMLLAIGKGSGSFEIWLCDLSCNEFHKLGSYDAHDHIVTSLAWAFNGRCLCSCSQDNLVRSWILHERQLNEVIICSGILKSSNPTCPSTDVYASCFGAAVSPGNLVIATVRCFDIEKLNRMYEARVLRAAIEYFWIGGQQMDVLSRLPFSYAAEEFSNLPKKELTYWGSNIVCFLEQYHCLDKPLVLWDIIAALSALKENDSIYVEHILIKWLSMSFLGSHTDLPAEKVLSKVSSNLSDIPSRLLHLLNILCRRVMLSELDADQINTINNNLLNSGGSTLSKEKQIIKWVEILLSSERELRERLTGFSFSAFLTNQSYAKATPSHPVHWYPFGITQMKQWVELDRDNARDQLKVLASKVSNEKRLLSDEHSAVERCSFCSACVPFESPEVGFCSGEDDSKGKGQRHRLLRCATSVQVCPIAPLWFCICCRRSAFRLPPDALFRMSAYPADFKSSINTSTLSVSAKPLCSFCGILLQRQQPDFLLSPTYV